MLAFLKRLLNPNWAYIDKLQADHAATVTGQHVLVRHGVSLTFVEHESGMTYVHATRRTKPFKRAVFQVNTKAEAIAWKEDGIVPIEIASLVSQLEAGTWPETLPNSEI